MANEQLFNLTIDVREYKTQGKKRRYEARSGGGAALGLVLLFGEGATPGTALTMLGGKIDQMLIQAQLDRLSGDSGD